MNSWASQALTVYDRSCQNPNSGTFSSGGRRKVTWIGQDTLMEPAKELEFSAVIIENVETESFVYQLCGRMSTWTYKSWLCSLALHIVPKCGQICHFYRGPTSPKGRWRRRCWCKRIGGWGLQMERFSCYVGSHLILTNPATRQVCGPGQILGLWLIL